jgi:PIN domain nuclease of toxin-antitoxin system
MNILLDTHIALWAITDDPRLSNEARQIINNPQATVWVSVASVWEIAIKHALGRGDMPVSSQEASRYFLESGYRFLSIEARHTWAVESLPAHHQDPFDRLIVAQAISEPMRLLTRDPQVAQYGESIVRV